MASIDFSLDSRVKKQNVSLLSQQRHLRHIKCIAARNLTPDSSDFSSMSSSPAKGSEKELEIESEDREKAFYFTLHNIDDDEILYHSEMIYNKSPSWRGFDGSSFSFSSSSQLIIRVYCCKMCKRESSSPTSSSSSPTRSMQLSSPSTLFLEWKVHLSGLIYVGEEIPKDNRLKENCVLFGLMEGFYTCPESLTSDGHELQTFPRESIPIHDETTLRTSYDINILYRIEMIQRVIGQTFSLVNKTRTDLEERLQSMCEKTELESHVECVEMRVRNLQYQLHCQREKLKVKNELKLKNDNDICDKGIDMLNKFQHLKLEREKLTEKRRKYDECRERLVKTKAQLRVRRKQLISELTKIYPMVPFPDGRGGFSICDVHLPNSEDFDGHDEIMISIALGYVSHVLVMIHKCLDVPMRYQINYFASRTTLYDHLNDKISEDDRHFPLHTKSGKHKLHFKYGVFLLNKNIAQLRQYLGLPTHDLRATLPNIYQLLQDKLLSVDEENTIDLNSSSCAISTVSYSGHVDDYLRREMEVMRNEYEQHHQPGTSSSTTNSYGRRKSSAISNNSIQSHNSVSDKSISRSLDKGLNEIVMKRKDIYTNESNSSTSSHGISSVPKHVINSVNIHQNLSESDLNRVRMFQKQTQNHNVLNNTSESDHMNEWPNSIEDEMLNNGAEISSSESSPRFNTINSIKETNPKITPVSSLTVPNQLNIPNE